MALGPRGERIIEGEGVWSGGKWPERTRELRGRAGAGGGHQPDLWAGRPGGATWPRFPHAAGRSENRAGLEAALQGAPAGGAAGAGDPAAAETAGAGALAAGQWGPASGVPRVPGGRPGSVGPSEAAGLGGGRRGSPPQVPRRSVSSRRPESEFVGRGPSPARGGGGSSGCRGGSSAAVALSPVGGRCADPLGHPEMDRKVRRVSGEGKGRESAAPAAGAGTSPVRSGPRAARVLYEPSGRALAWLGSRQRPA